MISLFFFILLFVYLVSKGNRSIVLVLVGIQIISLSGTFFLGRDYEFDSIFKIFNLLVTLFILSTLILPWRRFKNIKYIHSHNQIKLKRLTYFLILISIVPFIIYLIVSTFVLLYVDDINTFKYAEGVSIDFYYSLPIDVRLFIFSNYIYHVSYFLIPLHFYYLHKKNYWLSFLCFLFSLNIILYGLTYFSRSVYFHYGLLYFAFYFMLFSTFSYKVKKVTILVASFITFIFSAYFVYISVERFEFDKLYSETIPPSAIIQDPKYYNYFDYASQSYFNNLHLLEKYNFDGFNGQISLQPLLSFLGHFGIIEYDTNAYVKFRTQIWADNWFTFNGYVSYSVYDYGYIITFIISFLYIYLVKLNRPKTNRLSIINLFILVLLIQLPLMSIFYSTVSIFLFPLLYLIPIYIYLKVKF